jgi:hypothetical protein
MMLHQIGCLTFYACQSLLGKPHNLTLFQKHAPVVPKVSPLDQLNFYEHKVYLVSLCTEFHLLLFTK